MVAYDKLLDVSTRDYPGKLTMIMFMNHCPLDCRYCFNSAICNGTNNVPISVAEKSILGSAEFVDCITFTGGEPFMQIDALIHLSNFAKDIGLDVSVQTSGVYPLHVEKFLNAVDVDLFVMDVKAPLSRPDKYDAITRTIGNSQYVKSSLDLLKVYHPKAVEIRTTVTHELHTINDIKCIAKDIKSIASTYRIQNIRESINGLTPVSCETLQLFADAVREYVDNVITSDD